MKIFFDENWIEVTHVYICYLYHDNGKYISATKSNLPSEIDDESSNSDSYHYKKKKEQQNPIISRGLIK